jgi:CheY-like chemotaxis protein
MDTGRKLSVLVVEDHDDSRDLLRRLLNDDGHEVLEARHGREALEVLISREAKPGLIILDLDMPVMSGHEFLDMKAKNLALAAIPVVITSASHRAGKTLRHDAVVEVLKKPLDIAQLAAAVKKHARVVLSCEPGDD